MTKKSEQVRVDRFTYNEGDVVIGEPIDLDDLKGSDDHWKRNESWFSEGSPRSGHHGHDDDIVPIEEPESEEDDVREGGPTSGNWGHTGAPGQGGSSRGGGRVVGSLVNGTNVVEGLSREEYEYLKEELTMFDGKWKGDRRHLARAALAEIRDQRVDSAIFKFERGELLGIASLSLQDSPDRAYLSYLATRESGHGFDMMRVISKHALENKKGLEWAAPPDSRGFYNHIGFSDFKGLTYKVPVDMLTSWLSWAEGVE
jgi:hypothetical protein